MEQHGMGQERESQRYARVGVEYVGALRHTLRVEEHCMQELQRLHELKQNGSVCVCVWGGGRFPEEEIHKNQFGENCLLFDPFIHLEDVLQLQ